MSQDVTLEALVTISPVLQALLATLFTWGVTALGAAAVFLPIRLSRKLLDGMLGFAGGVMIAASFWSLLAPALEYAEDGPVPPWVPAVVGFLLGGVALRGIDRVLPHLHASMPGNQPEGVRTNWNRAILLILAITLHNIPEGLAVGVAFGAAANSQIEGSVMAAVALAVGIGLQNFPEGLAVAAPLQREGLSRRKSFLWGQASALVEPVAGVFGALAVTLAQPILPYALAFAAGAMIFVVVEDVIPESQRDGNTDISTFGVMMGFALMMLLDVALG